MHGEETSLSSQLAAAMLISLGQSILALRAHHGEHDPAASHPVNTAEERAFMQVFALESARLFGDVSEALRMRDRLDALSDEAWWQFKFVLHPNVLTFLHYRLV